MNLYLMPPADFVWPRPWRPIDREDDYLAFGRMLSENFGHSAPAPLLAAELQREVCNEHPLSNRCCVPIAYALDDPNEFLFVTDHREFPIAFVHLTWTIESYPAFPHTVGYPSWEEFQRIWLRDNAK